MVLSPTQSTLFNNLRDFVREGASFSEQEAISMDIPTREAELTVVLENETYIGPDGLPRIPPPPDGPYASFIFIQGVTEGIPWTEKQYTVDSNGDRIVADTTVSNVNAEVAVNFAQGGAHAYDYCNRFILWATSPAGINFASERDFSFKLMQPARENDDLVQQVWEHRFIVTMEIGYISELRIANRPLVTGGMVNPVLAAGPVIMGAFYQGFAEVGGEEARGYLLTGVAGWNDGVAVPSGVTAPGGLATDLNGDWLLLGYASNRIYRSADRGATWNRGIAGPAGETQPEGLAVAPNGDWLVAGAHNDKIFKSTDQGATWDNGVAGPAGEGYLDGIAVTPEGHWVVTGDHTDKIFKSTDQGATWDNGVGGPVGETGPTGLTIDILGNWIILGDTTNKIFTSSNEGRNWDSGLAGPTGETNLFGVATTRNGAILLAGGAPERKIYTYVPS